MIERIDHALKDPPLLRRHDPKGRAHVLARAGCDGVGLDTHFFEQASGIDGQHDDADTPRHRRGMDQNAVRRHGQVVAP